MLVFNLGIFLLQYTGLYTVKISKIYLIYLKKSMRLGANILRSNYVLSQVTIRSSIFLTVGFSFVIKT